MTGVSKPIVHEPEVMAALQVLASYGWSKQSGKGWQPPKRTHCAFCSCKIERISKTRPVRYCGNECRQKAYRQRHGTKRKHPPGLCSRCHAAPRPKSKGGTGDYQAYCYPCRRARDAEKREAAHEPPK